MKVLVVDDNTEITDMLSDFLNLSGMEVIICNNGKQGLDLILEGNYDKVLLDLAMPDFSGMDVIDHLKQNNFQNMSKIYIFTASSVSEAEIQRLLSTGIKSCIMKPVRMPELVEKLNE
jgi:DNA-binding response OmpR family regulator